MPTSRAAAMAKLVRCWWVLEATRPTSIPVTARVTPFAVTMPRSRFSGSLNVASPMPEPSAVSKPPSMKAGTSGVKPVSVQIPSPQANVPYSSPSAFAAPPPMMADMLA